jgi:predicted AAA+ superfamily ATPase
VDFLIKKGVGIEEAIKICASLAEKRTGERELEGLLSAAEELKVKTLTVITEDEEGKEVYGKRMIQITPLWKWLLSSF